MEPTSAAIMGGATLLGGILRNKEAKSASARQMAFQREMSDTSYQRGMRDMQKAGLNPILAGKMGGASTPTGSTYQPENVAVNAVNQYLATKQNVANVEKTNAETQKIRAETKVTRDSSGSILGKTVEYIAKSVMQTYEGLSENEIVNKVMDHYGQIFANTGKNINQVKQYVTGIVSDMFNSKKQGVRITIPLSGIIMPDGTIKKIK